MTDIIASIFILTGTLFLLIAAIGVIRLPDLYTQIHAVAKAPTLALYSMMIGICIHFYSWIVFGEVFIIVIFITIAAPVAAHLLARAAYHNKEPLYKSSANDVQSQ